MTKHERLREIIERFNQANAGHHDAIEIALAMFQTDDGRELLHMAKTEQEWNWQDWLHHEGKYEHHEFQPPDYIKMQIANDWKLRKIYCTKCKGRDNCGKYNNKRYWAGLDQKRYGGKMDQRKEQAINYLVWQPCKYNDEAQYKSAAANSGRSDYL